jgi:hypothetical protein
LSILTSCNSKKTESKEEQIRVDAIETPEDRDTANSIQGNISLNQFATIPSYVVLTGLPKHRLVPVYKNKAASKARDSYSSSGYSYDNDATESERWEHFMPGIDILYGYNLLNIAHYDLQTEKLNSLFAKPGLIKTLYYPSLIQDSLNKKPISRNFYLVSVYDEDTNGDTLINRKDLRRFYLFDSTGTVKTQLIPADYSVMRSQYDSQNDLMYLYAKHDDDKNGKVSTKEPTHIFWFSLSNPFTAKRLY